MSVNVSTERPFRWTEKTTRAAALVAEDRLTDAAIAVECGVTERQLERWKKHEDFKARVAEHVAVFRQTVLSRGIARLENRVAALQDRWDGMKTVIQERGAEMDGETPGGGTGLLVRQIKAIGSGESAREAQEYAVDTGLLKELREHEKQAAQELGQWTDRQDVTSGGEAISFVTVPPGDASGDSGPEPDDPDAA
jgi:hypothetical protein